MKAKNILFITVAICGSMILHSCEKIDSYLDKSPTGGLTEEQVFSNYKQADQFLANVYSKLPDEWYPASSNTFSYATVSDEATTSIEEGSGPQGIAKNGLLSPIYNPLGKWNNLYVAVRSVNIFLSNTKTFEPKTAAEVTGMARMRGEAFFLRAWFYAELFKRYGGVPLIDGILKVTDDLNIPRNTTAETVHFIVADCDSAAALLPAAHIAVNEGRATKGAALMLKAKILVHAASPLHSPQQSEALWQQAAQAAKAVMDLGVYEVDTDYKSLFHRRNTRNLIFQSTHNQTLWAGTSFPLSLGGICRVQPLQNLVDAYEMQATGKGITEPGSGYDPQSPYTGRDPRFYLSVIYDGAAWKGNVINTYLGAGADAIQPAGGVLPTQTGYYLAKTVDENANLVPNNIAGEHFWVYMRYEETLLLYAEAQNEATASPGQSVYDAVNKVRTRAGVNMPPLPAGLTKEQMRERIRHERQVELAFEGQRFWDIRRWRIGETAMKEAHGMLVEKNGNTKKYTPFLLYNRIYKPAFDLFPIPQDEIDKQGALVQNPDYD